MKICCQLNLPDIPLHYGQSMPVNNKIVEFIGLQNGLNYSVRCRFLDFSKYDPHIASVILYAHYGRIV